MLPLFGVQTLSDVGKSRQGREEIGENLKTSNTYTNLQIILDAIPPGGVDV